MTTTEPWRIGILFSQSGTTALIEQTQLNAVLIAIDEINAAGGVRGQPIEPVVYDPQSSPERYAACAERLLSEDGVRIIVGGYMSSTRKAVLPVVERRNGLLAYPAMYEGFEFSRNVIYAGATPNQHSVPLARYLIANYGKRFYLVGTRYVFPVEANRVMTTLVTEHQGQVVSERYVSFEDGRRVFDDIVRDIRSKAPDVIFATVVGENANCLYRAYRDAGLDPARMPIASLTTTETEIAEMGADMVSGHITAATYFQSLPGEANRTFVARYRSRFGAAATTNALCEAAYFQTRLIADGLQEAGSTDPDVLLPALAGRGIGAPQGLVRMDPDNHHCYLWPRIGRALPSGQFEVLVEPARPVKPDPYMVDHSLDDWGNDVGQSHLAGALP
ncbi:MAG: transporter substrate-binding domain-containing protein [Alphaproteobacteria bacterium]